MLLVSFVVGHALAATALGATVWALGRCCLRRLGASPWSLAVAVGFAVGGQALILLGLLGALRPGIILVLVGLAHAVTWREWRRAIRRTASWFGRGRPRWIALATGVGLATLFALALYPPTGFDETLYHLPFARAFALSGALPFLPDLRAPVFPPLYEVLEAALLLLASDIATHFIAAWAVAATAGLLWVCGPDLASPRAGRVAAALWLGSPIVIYLAGTGYVEPLLTLLVWGAFAAAARHRREQSAPVAWLAVAGLLAGSAASVKYLGLFFVAWIGLQALILPRRVAGGKWRAVGAYALTAAAAMAPTYGRLLLHTGNPIFPFYPSLFGSSPWDPVMVILRAGATNLPGLLALPWRLPFDRQPVGWLPPYSPAILFVAPLAMLGLFGLTRRRARPWAALALAYAAAVPLDARYLLPALPALSLAAAAVGESFLARRRGRHEWRPYGLPLLAALLIPGPAYAALTLGRRGPPPVSAEAREAYLERWLGLYPAVRFLNRTYGSRYTVFGLFSETMVYWADGRLLGDHFGLLAYPAIVPLFDQPRELHSVLQMRGVSLLLLPLAQPTRLLPRADADACFRLVYRDTLAEIYELTPRCADQRSQ